MTLAKRLLLIAASFALGLVLQASLNVHLSHAQVGDYPELRRPLETLPLQLTTPSLNGGAARPVSAAAWAGLAATLPASAVVAWVTAASDSASAAALAANVWQGADHADLDALRARVEFADGLISRHYRSQTRGQIVSLYMVYSRVGEDRKHHPEVCIREVAGAPEDLSARGQVTLDTAGQRRVQRFRFRTGTSESILVYYWHYTLDAEPNPQHSFLQHLHVRLSHAAPSITVQVSTRAPLSEAEDIESGFLPALDGLLHNEYLPATARIGCERLPIGLVRHE